mmetsp:Transcript_15155/g.49707  ORF Transcript_15155/g.49707 Transcript_15155/m.49707 type:complete len:314 (-) Transcript_15155:670-1611(-)
MDSAKRVVFISVRGREEQRPRTRRKRALGLDANTSWDGFVTLVCQRLQLRGVKGVYHASGQRLTSIDDLQDVEDLVVEEADEPAGPPPSPPAHAVAPPPLSTEVPNGHRAPAPDSGPPSSSSAGGVVGELRHSGPAVTTRKRAESDNNAAGVGAGPSSSGGGAGGVTGPGGSGGGSSGLGGTDEIVAIDQDESEWKYVRRAPFHIQMLQKFAPSLLPAKNLPSTTGGGGGGGGGGDKLGRKESGDLDKLEAGTRAGLDQQRGGGAAQAAKRRKRRGGGTDFRTVLIAISLLSCLGTMLLLYSKIAPLPSAALP